jgi:hypothetical protein
MERRFTVANASAHPFIPPIIIGAESQQLERKRWSCVFFRAQIAQSDQHGDASVVGRPPKYGPAALRIAVKM